MQIRPGSIADIPFFLHQESREAFQGCIQSWSHAKHANSLIDPDKRYLIAEDEESIKVGYAIFSEFTSPHHALYLQRLVVAEPGRGVGRRFFTALLDMAFGEWEKHRLWLHVFPDNQRARNFYLRYGFQEEGLHRDAVLMNGRFHSWISMALLAPEWHGAERRDSTLPEA
ncbi:MAG: GNAT family N-acetyltransferase [Magnetococcales bacterium]|nr:GNAT family N-acetyltransferase [Magnetococcales bacterium]